jgi:hypothetical protein
LARGRGARAKLRAPQGLEELADRCQRIAAQIGQRQRGEPITDRLVSLADPDARPIRKGKLGTPTSSAMSPSWPRSPPTPPAAPAAICCRRPARRATRARTAWFLRPPPSWSAWGFDPGRWRWTAGSCPARPPRPWPRSHQPERSSRDVPSQAPGAPAGAWPATAPAVRVGSATPSVATTCAAAASKATRPADLDRLGDPGLQPRHPRHPHHPTQSTTGLRSSRASPGRSDGLTPARLSGASS